MINPRTGHRAALKKIPNVHQSLLACIRTFREVKILCELDHENVRNSDVDEFYMIIISAAISFIFVLLR